MFEWYKIGITLLIYKPVRQVRRTGHGATVVEEQLK